MVSLGDVHLILKSSGKPVSRKERKERKKTNREKTIHPSREAVEQLKFASHPLFPKCPNQVLPRSPCAFLW